MGEMAGWLCVRPTLGLLLGSLFGCLLVAPAAAQEPTAAQEAETIEQTRARARELFNRGSAAFEAGEHNDALAAFEASYALVPRPEILFNAARSAEEAGQHAVALRYYTQLAASSNSAAERASLGEAMERVRALALAEAEREPDPELTAQPPPEPTPPTLPAAHDAPAWPWALASGGALALVAGVVLAVVGALDVSAINASGDGAREWSDVEPDAQRAHALIIAGGVTMGVGAAAGGAGLGVALSSSPDPEQASFVGVGGRF